MKFKKYNKKILSSKFNLKSNANGQIKSKIQLEKNIN